MVQAGRVACIALPFILTLGALVCLVLVFLAGTIEKSNTFDSWYFLKLDLSNITVNSISSSTNGATTLAAAKEQLGMKDYYTIYLRNYCAWNNNETTYSYCSPRQSKFYFNPIEVWGLNTTTTGSTSSSTTYDINTLIPAALRTGLSTYKTLSYAMFYTYTIGLSATALTLIIGISAIFSRWGSLFTTFFSSLSAILILISSVLATAMFPILKTALHKSLDEDYGTFTSIGSQIYIITWIATAFAVGGGLFWLLSICCCSGRSPYNPGSKDARRTRAERTPYTYERVGSPYLGPSRDSQAVPLGKMSGGQVTGHTGYQSGPMGQRDGQNAYEPFRPLHS